MSLSSAHSLTFFILLSFLHSSSSLPHSIFPSLEGQPSSSAAATPQSSCLPPAPSVSHSHRILGKAVRSSPPCRPQRLGPVLVSFSSSAGQHPRTHLPTAPSQTRPPCCAVTCRNRPSPDSFRPIGTPLSLISRSWSVSFSSQGCDYLSPDHHRIPSRPVVLFHAHSSSPLSPLGVSPFKPIRHHCSRSPTVELLRFVDRHLDFVGGIISLRAGKRV